MGRTHAGVGRGDWELERDVQKAIEGWNGISATQLAWEKFAQLRVNFYKNNVLAQEIYKLTPQTKKFRK